MKEATPTERREPLAAWVDEIVLDKQARSGEIRLRRTPASAVLTLDRQLASERE